MNNIVIFSAKYLLFLEIAIFVIYFFLQPRGKQKSIITLSVVFLPLAYIIARVVAFIYFDPRPFVVGHFTPLISHAPDNGFPSDHMLLASAIASIIFIYNKKLGTIAWTIAFIIGVSRVFAGVHHWIDIIGSAVIAIGVIWLVRNQIMVRLLKTNFIGIFLKKEANK